MLPHLSNGIDIDPITLCRNVVLLLLNEFCVLLLCRAQRKLYNYYYYYYYYYLLSLSLLLTSASSTKRYYIVGGSGEEERQENGKKVGVKRKWWVLAEPPYSPQGKGKRLQREEPFNQGDSTGRRYCQRLGGQERSGAHFSRYIHLTQE